MFLTLRAPSLLASAHLQAWICGPARGHSLDRFVDCARAGGLCIDRRDRFDERVWSMHCAFAAAESASLIPGPKSDPTAIEQVDCNAPPTQPPPQYVPDRHQPILLVVTLPRPER
jgi:hypothetical protein